MDSDASNDRVASALRARLASSATASSPGPDSPSPASPTGHISSPLTDTLTPPTPPSLQSALTPPAALAPHGTLPNSPLAVSVISALLGGVVAGGGVVLWMGLAGGASGSVRDVPSDVRDVLKEVVGAQVGHALPRGLRWLRPQLAAYLMAWSTFHLLEFWVTARWNPRKLSVDSFLLNNGVAYHIAHAFGVCEFLVERWIWPDGWMALPVIIAAQALRSLAMIHAAQSFSHLVSRKTKADDHVLVTSGVYAYSRHPSYTGFFYWALGTQVFLGNPLAVLGFAKVLGSFFHHRIVDEEVHLTRFFGDEYREYKKRVGTWLPYGLVNVG